MKFSYSFRQLIVNLIMGLVWIGLGIRSLYINETIDYKPIVFIIVGVLFLALFIFQYTKKYFEVTDDWIEVSSIFDKKININDLTKVIFTSGIYVFTSRNKRIKIVQPKIKRDQIASFNKVFDKIKKKVDKKNEKSQ